MKIRKQAWILSMAVLGTVAAPITVWGQGRPDPAAPMAAQREALAKLSFMDGVWRGPASTTLPNGTTHAITQTERIGPLLGGTIKLIEGRGYEADGKTTFNAFAVISYNVAAKAYNFHSHAQGLAGDFVLKLNPEGYSWEIPAGPMTIRYHAVVKNGEWVETGDRVEGDKLPVRFFEMRLNRVGDSDWPAAGAISPK